MAMVMYASKTKICLLLLLILKTSNAPPPQQQLYNLVDSAVVTPQWLQNDLYEHEENDETSQLRYPHPEKRYSISNKNQELVMLSTKDQELVPSCKHLLELTKRNHRLLHFNDFTSLKRFGVIDKHLHAVEMGLRIKTFRYSDKILLAALYLPTGWPILIFLAFLAWIFIVPTFGSALVIGGEKVTLVFSYVIWGPIKRLLRLIVIRREAARQRWLRYLAPSYYLEPRSAWKIPYFLRHEYLEDITPEVAYRPPINKIDYTMYVLNPEDYDELDLEMDELEFIDEMLQFREENPHAVALLLKHKLGIEKFYSYFDEDILSDEEDMDLPTAKEEEEKEKEEHEKGRRSLQQLDLDFHMEAIPDYMKALEVDEPWMHDEFDETFEGTPYHLEEIRRRRELIMEIKDEIRYLQGLITTQTMYEGNMAEFDVATRIRLQKKAKKLLDRYVKYSQVTKERIAELEPSQDVQFAHNVALSKYLPLINQMSHFNHRLNLKHEKQTEGDRRVVQLDVFGGP